MSLHQTIDKNYKTELLLISTNNKKAKKRKKETKREIEKNSSISSLMAEHLKLNEPLLPLQSEQPTQSTNTNSNSLLSSIISNKYIQIISGPLICFIIILFFDPNGSGSSRNMLAVLAWIFTWWLTEAVPMAVTSMSPLFLFPLFGIASSDDVAKNYMDDVIALVLGSFILALAVEHYNIHKRLALNITSLFCGDPLNPPLLLLGISGTTFFVSMWMHNTSTAIMMIPVATGILQRLPLGSHVSGSSSDAKQFCKAMILGVIYSAAIGGMSTLTGTGVNLILVGMWGTYFPKEAPISFSTWFCFGFPFALILFFVLWIVLCVLYCSKSTSKSLAPYLDRTHLKRELELLGPMAFAEKIILAVFGGLITLWMTRSITNDIPGWSVLFHGNVGDGTVSVMMATLLFIIPNKKIKGEKLMDWNKCKKLPWNIILLLGAGFAIASGVQTSGLADDLSETLTFLKTAPYLTLAPLACLISAIITEFTSNNSATTLVVPLLIELARSMSVHPLILMVPGAIGAQFAFLLPTGTPSNVVGFGTGHIEVMDMIKVGLPLKIAGLAVMSVLMPTLGAFVFGTNKQLMV